jgi:hypothetical protein
MLFAIDIDRTIAEGFKAYVEHHNRDLGLGIHPDVLDTLTGYQSFQHLPEVIEHRRKAALSKESDGVTIHIFRSVSF